MEIDPSAMTAIVLFVVAQVILSIRQSAKQSALIDSLKEFTVDTKKRFDNQDQIIANHGDTLTKHSTKLGHLFGYMRIKDEHE